MIIEPQQTIGIDDAEKKNDGECIGADLNQQGEMTAKNDGSHC